MDNLNLDSDDAIIQKTQTLIINGVGHEAVLTSRRLILVESETGTIREDIRFAEIDLARAGRNKLREPIITLIFNSPGGEKRTLELIFIRLTGNQNIVQLEKCIAILKEHNVPTEVQSQLTDPARWIRGDRTNTGELVVEEEVSRPAAPEWTILGSSRNNKQSLPEEPPERSPLNTIAAIFIIFIVIIGGMIIMGQIIRAQTQPAPQNMTESVVTSVVTISPSPSTTPTPAIQETSVPTASVPEIMIPPNGVWVRVQYPGYYSGYIGARGRNVEVNNTGTRWYQVPVVNPVIDGSIEKLDGSADKLEVEIYKDGTLISRKSTKSPFGLIELLSTGSEDITNNGVTNVVLLAPVPTAERQVTEDYLPTISIPPAGVWVRVYYPGFFSGSVGGRGLFTPIESTGDQLYSLPVNVAIVEGTIEKEDGSVGKLVTEVYKDGVRISQMETSTPYGLIDLHVPV